jgi:O-antigen/teichoic acid export membrane protein
LLKSMALTLCLGGAVLLVFVFFGDITIKLLFGVNYVEYAHMLPKAGVVMLLSSVLNVFVNYFLALRRLSLIGLSLVGSASLAITLFLAHASINDILNDLIVSLSIIIGLFIVYYLYESLHHHTNIQ